MRPPLPGLGDVVGAVGGALGEVAGLPMRVESLLARFEAIADRADAALDEAEAMLAHTGKVLDGADSVQKKARHTIDGAKGMLDRTDALLLGVDAPAQKLLPALNRLADTLSPAEVEAAVALIDRLPTLLEHVDTDLLPMLRQLEQVGPDVHGILEIVDDLRRVLTGLPGVGLLRNRGDEEPPPKPTDDASAGDD